MTNWIICPFIDLWDMTRQACEDFLAQEGVEPRVLLVANDCSDETLARAEFWVGEQDGKVLLWNHKPALPALGGTWNRALEFCWEAGAEEVLVVNNDVRLRPQTYDYLRFAIDEDRALFVSAVGITEEQFHPEERLPSGWGDSKGGPDYSCFVISKECHQKYPFDPELTYAGDLDHHRRIMLAGEGERIFSVNVPYLHFASQTIADKPWLGKVADQHRAYYARKWGGSCNEETFVVPFTGPADTVVTTSALFERVRQAW